MLFAVQLDGLGRDAGVRAFSLHPGGILTPLQRHLTHEEMVGYGWIAEDGNAAQRVQDARAGRRDLGVGATSPQLDGMGGVYCEDCDVAELVPADDEERGRRAAPTRSTRTRPRGCGRCRPS